ncbi:discoidin domain-containing protein [Massilibacteroides vaginae]|uniref:discoidin domain-containing protein n=1 Tax=Massilibacteroides vaginae TaxID=1673718 RepID=UPI00111C83AD|nr:discoidin domain-containing protein [Massilibacteroides vaginae]
MKIKIVNEMLKNDCVQKMDILCVVFTCLSFFISFSCSFNAKDTKLDNAFSLAGKNREELEKVLLHYQQNDNDSLKYKAACFLIENIAYHYSYENEVFEEYKNSLKQIICLADTLKYKTMMDNFLKDTIAHINQVQFSKKKSKPICDLETISAEYLIANIDHAFMVWEKQPWGKHISFDLFCHEILPYRIVDEPIEEWRQAYYDYFQPVLDSLLTDDSPITACQLVYDTIVKMKWHFIPDLPVPHLGGKILLDYRLENCREYSDFALYVMRALGICGGVDLLIQNPDYNFTYHYWNYVRDITGQIKEFELYAMRPDSVREDVRMKGVVYRQNFCIQKESLRFLYPDKDIPPTLVTPFLSNVSDDYFKGYDINIPASKIEELLYLYVFDNKEWRPIIWSDIKKGGANFHSLEPGIAFFPGHYEGGKFEPVSDPFILAKDKSAKFFTPDTVKRVDLVLRRKFRKRSHLMDRYAKRTYQGQFEGANRPDFKEGESLFPVYNIEEPEYYERELALDRKFRYIRYLSRDTLCCNMAELEFLGIGDTLIDGDIIGSECLFGENTKYSNKTVFDRDPLTFFHAKDTTEGWVGMDFGSPQRIEKIRFLFRNDDNNIREGDIYELFYYTKDGYKKSLGKQTGNREQCLTFRNCPSNALYLLHDHTRGREQRIFSYEDGKQIWW